MCESQSDKIPTSLPLLDYISKRFQIQKNRPFEGYKILAVQHLLGSTIPLFSMFEKGGVSPKDVFVVGKAYSSHPLVINELIRRGYRVSFDTVFDFDSNRPYDDVLSKHIREETVRMIKAMGDVSKGLIIDDGGKAIRLLHESYKHLVSEFSCVEQTSRGARVVSSLTLGCPVVNVARCDAKTLVESPVVAKAMVEELLSSLLKWEKHGVFHLTEKTVLVVGYGFIGEEVAKKFLENGFVVYVFDTDIEKRKRAGEQGMMPVENPVLCYPNIRLLVGSTGTSVMKEDDFNRLPRGILLANMASTDTEFSAWNLRPKGVIVFQMDLEADREYIREKQPLPWRSLYHVTFDTSDFYLANGGFPTDFSGKINPIPAEDIQLTSALLLGGALQAVTSKKAEFLDLDSVFQSEILQEFQRIREI